MYWLGVCYENGLNGLAKDAAQARAWFERSAAVGCPEGLAAFGTYSLLGLGGSVETSLGLVTVSQAAALGSDLGSFRLSWAFFKGLCGLPKDPVRARFWIKKIVDGECKHKHMNDAYNADAARMLRELDEAGD